MPAEQKEPGHPLNTAKLHKIKSPICITDLSPHFLHNQQFNMDQKEQNLQMALANFKAGKFEFSLEAIRVYNILLLTFSN